MQKILELRHISKEFDGQPVLRDISLDVHDNEFVTLLGPSGCGKTTTLRIIGGFESPDQGDVVFMGDRINDVPPHRRNVNTVFQKYALFPHLNVFENIAFSLRQKRVARSEIRSRVNDMLALVKLSGFGERRVTKLSGGQQQRVAIARALINRPRIVLLDEPLGALDYKLRKDMQIELKNIQDGTGITFIFVTHDQQEALSMSDTVVVMNDGKIQQIGSPENVYNKPVNAFVANFIGESNIVDGIIQKDRKVRFAGHNFDYQEKGFSDGESVDVVVRPEDIRIVSPEEAQLCGEVVSTNFLGVYSEIIVDVHGFKWLIQTMGKVDTGMKIGLGIPPDAIHMMKKSEYSGMFGDYSSYSEELDELSRVVDEAENW